MKQFIAPQMLKVTGKPSPCECINQPRKQIICAYCVQANLIVWAREEEKTDVVPRLLRNIKKQGVRKTGILTGIPRSTIARWLKNEMIPRRYIEKISRGCPTGV